MKPTDIPLRLWRNLYFISERLRIADRLKAKHERYDDGDETGKTYRSDEMPKIDDYVQLAAQTAREIAADGGDWRRFCKRLPPCTT